MDTIKEIGKKITLDKNGLYRVDFTYTTQSGAMCYDSMYFYNSKDAAKHIKKIENMIRGNNNKKRII